MYVLGYEYRVVIHFLEKPVRDEKKYLTKTLLIVLFLTIFFFFHLTKQMFNLFSRYSKTTKRSKTKNVVLGRWRPFFERTVRDRKINKNDKSCEKCDCLLTCSS